jgi:hypothetical protein
MANASEMTAHALKYRHLIRLCILATKFNIRKPQPVRSEAHESSYGFSWSERSNGSALIHSKSTVGIL